MAASADFGYERTLPDTPFAEAVQRVKSALAEEGFGVLTEIDVEATLRKKLDVDFRPYVILGACNPQLAHRALEAEPRIGVLLPCNVTVESVDGGSRVVVANPQAMFSVVDAPDVGPVMEEADSRLRRVVNALG